MNVTIDLDLIRMQTKKPAWDFALEMGGVKYVTRELTEEDEKRLTTSSAAFESPEGRELLASLFTAETRPPVETWDDVTSRAVLGSVMSYFRTQHAEYLRAFHENCAKVIRAEMDLKRRG